MNTIIFEDELVTRLHPITLARPAYAITCGGYRLVNLISECGLGASRPTGIVRPHLQDIQRQDFPNMLGELNDEPTLLVNARVVPSIDNVTTIANISRQNFRIDAGKSIAAALLPAGSLTGQKPVTMDDVHQLLRSPVVRELPRVEQTVSVFDYPHDVIRSHVACMASNLTHRIAQGKYREMAGGVFVGDNVQLGDALVADTTAGPILIEQGARVGPHCFLRGPLWIGCGATINEHASIKDAVCLGHTTKVGGEIAASVIEPYSNKQHFGYLGNSYLGSWINLGAGTCNSDLKNTYGKIRVDYDGDRVDTGMQFFGCILGDYTKSAINTSIFTGKVIGVCSMLYGFVTRNVPSFANYAQSFGQTTEMSPDVMIETQRRTFLRRKIKQRDCDIKLIRDMYQFTEQQRVQLSSQPLSL